MTGGIGRLLLLAVCSALFLGCASAGRVQLAEEPYRFNRSAIEQEDDHYRLWVWRYRAWPFGYFGESPIGLQMLIPASVEQGARLDIGQDCHVWIRADWNLVGAAANSLWADVQSGTLVINAWEPDNAYVRGQIDVMTTNGPLGGTFVVSKRTLSDNVIR